MDAHRLGYSLKRIQYCCEELLSWYPGLYYFFSMLAPAVTNMVSMHVLFKYYDADWKAHRVGAKRVSRSWP